MTDGADHMITPDRTEKQCKSTLQRKILTKMQYREGNTRKVNLGEMRRAKSVIRKKQKTKREGEYKLQEINID